MTIKKSELDSLFNILTVHWKLHSKNNLYTEAIKIAYRISQMEWNFILGIIDNCVHYEKGIDEAIKIFEILGIEVINDVQQHD